VKDEAAAIWSALDAFEVGGYGIIPLPIRLIEQIGSNLTSGLQTLWGCLKGSRHGTQGFVKVMRAV
jgi:hypothetical protein